LRSTPEGSVVEGTIRFRYWVWIFVLFLAVLAVSLVPPLLAAGEQDIAAGDYGRAAPPIALVLGIIVLPAVWLAHDLRRGRREGYALRDRIVRAVTARATAGTPD
jgi:hypothetical protein